MSKAYLLVAGFLLVTTIACKKESALIPQQSDSHQEEVPFRDALWRYSGSDYSQPIHKDTAERMIQSYLASIASTGNSTDFQSLTFSASTLRAYLSNDTVETLKFILAHKRNYANSNSNGIYNGLKSSSLTFLLAGLDENDNYVKTANDTVFDMVSGVSIVRDTANKMIESFLNSVGFPSNTTKLQSLTFDADTMRSYLSNLSIMNVKLAMAHHDYYINNDKYGIYAGAAANAITIVVTGMDINNNKIYYNTNMVMEHFRPCPSFCTSAATITQ